MKYIIKDLVDIERLKDIFAKFSVATGFTTGLVAYPSQEILIATGWRDICQKFHRAFPESAQCCKESNIYLTERLTELKALRIRECGHGLVDGATPIIIKGKHLANLTTGQVLFKEPNIDRFKQQAALYGYDLDEYLKALSRVPVVSEARFKAVLSFLSEVASMMAEQGFQNLEFKETAQDLEQEIIYRRVVEAALRKTEEKYRLLVSQIPAVVFRGYGDWSVDFFDKKVEALTGYPKEDFDSRRVKWCDLIPREDFGYAQKVFMDALKTNKSYVREHRLRRKNGEIIWVQCRGQIFEDESGKVDYISGVSFDITASRRAEEKLREQLAFQQVLMDTIPSPIFYKNTEGIYLGCNQALSEFLGLPKEEIIGKSVYDVYPPDLADKYQEMDAALFRQPGVQIYDFSMLHADGTRHDVIFYKATYSTIDGTLAGLVGVMIDITARKRAEEALRESEQRLANIIDFLPDATLVIDNEGKVITWNKAIEEMTGVKAQDMVGQGNYEYALPFYGERRPILIDLVRQPREELGKYAEVKREGLALSGVVHFPAFRGREAYLFGKAGILLDSHGNNMGAIESIRDITDGRKAEAERLRISKLESLGTLAGGIAHDFNNILTAILGNIGLAILDGRTEGGGLERLTKAEQACLKAQALAQQLLTFAKGGIPIKKPTNLAKILRESANLALVGSKARGDFSLPEDLWGVEVDEGQIDQAISNLLINANQAMPEGGTITVEARNVLWEESMGSPLPPGKYVEMTIADEGIGIPAKYLDKLFDPYFTTKQQGSGLGLATAYSIIKNHRGYLTVESEVGVGTTFHSYLPALDKRVPAPKEEAEKPLMGRGRILVMDDEEMVREVLARMLARLGYEVKSARDGEEAVEVFAQAKESGETCAAVILDLTVPGGMGGKEAMGRLLKIDPQVKAVVSSGYSDDPIMANFRQHGFRGVIAKPYQITELSRILAEVIGDDPSRSV